MGFFKNIFHSSTGADIDGYTLFTERLTDHRMRMIAAGSEYAHFLNQYLQDETISLLAQVASEKMRQTQADMGEHSIAIAKTPVCYVICTIPEKIERAASWFEQRYGGYTKVLEGCWNSSTYTSAKCQVLIHITYGRTKSNGWVNVTIFPIKSNDFAFQPIIAIDLLSAEEKRVSGIN